MRAYYFDNIEGDQRRPHDSSIPVDGAVLHSIGVLYWRIPVPTTDGYPQVDAVARERGYKNRDVITITREGLGDLYETKLKREYACVDPRFSGSATDKSLTGTCTKTKRSDTYGSGFFDVRDRAEDKWIRCAVDAGDLMVQPAGIYHRFTLDEKNVIRVTRLFKNEPKWIPYNRSGATDVNPFRRTSP